VLGGVGTDVLGGVVGGGRVTQLRRPKATRPTAQIAAIPMRAQRTNGELASLAGSGTETAMRGADTGAGGCAGVGLGRGGSMGAVVVETAGMLPLELRVPETAGMRETLEREGGAACLRASARSSISRLALGPSDRGS
jgi:hypothetical protein